VCADSSTYLSSYPMLIGNYGELCVTNVIILLLKFKVSLFAANHLLVRYTTYLNIQKSSKFLLEVMILISLENITGTARIFIVGRRSFI
jgi:NADH:ubiquinone oxidoreductase subunit K